MRKFILLLVLLCVWTGGSIYMWNVYVMPPKAEAYTVEVPREIDLDKFIARTNPKLDPSVRQLIAKAIAHHSERQSLDPALVAAVIAVESTYDPLSSNYNKDTNSRDHGLMMINDYYQRERIKRKGLTINNVYPISTNIELGCEILRENLDRFGNLREALQAYVGKSKPGYPPKVLSIYGETMWEAR